MTRSQFFCIMAAVAMGGMAITCNKSSNPASPPPVIRNVLLSDGFEDTSVPLKSLTYAPGWGCMSISTANPHNGTRSLTSDSSRTGIKEDFTTIYDSIAGLEFYLMAKKAEHINFYGAIARMGSAWNGLFAILGIGISATTPDSLMYVYQINPEKPELNEQKCFALLQTNKWYKCVIEYDFTTNDLTYSVDGQVVAAKTTSPMMMLGLFVTARDELGSQGPKEYYIDDVTIYKR